MGYTLTIGKAVLRDEDDEDGGTYWAAEDCEGPAPHSDEWEAKPYAGSPLRCPSYSQWTEVVDSTQMFKALWHRLEAWAKENQRTVIPVTEYARDLDALEEEAQYVEACVAARILWFAKWSRHALKLYGEGAVFETPGEWENWTWPHAGE